jgi:tetratricopeptide (TPR) repeat protein
MSTGKKLMTGSALLRGRAARVFVFVLAAMALFSEAAWAEAAFSQYAEKLRAKGDRYFRAGDYPKAIESYRCAVLEQPTNGYNKLAMGHALFAWGNYSYAAYALRRGIRSFDAPDDLKMNLVEFFPSRRHFSKALGKLHRQVSFSPRDLASLTVLGYVYHYTGKREKATLIFKKIRRLRPNDPFAAFFLHGASPESAPKAHGEKPPVPPEPPVEAKRAEPAPPARKEEKPPEPPKVAGKRIRLTPKDGERAGETSTFSSGKARKTMTR